MADQTEELRRNFLIELAAVTDEHQATSLRDRWLGRKNGMLSAEMKKLGALSPDERKTIGASLNEFKNEVEETIAGLHTTFASAKEALLLAQEKIDVTMPGRRFPARHAHPITLLRERIEDIFTEVASGAAGGS